MITVIQRVTRAEVAVGERVVGRIGPGLLALVAVERGDTEAEALRLAERMLGYRIFGDTEGKMNRNVGDVAGGVLLVSQFTLAADTRSGLRPSFSSAAPPAHGEALYDYLLARARDQHPEVACGRFGAEMQVHLVNDGPVTFLLES